MIDVTLRGKDFSTIHNALCHLRQVTDRLTKANVFDASELRDIVAEFESGLQDAWRQDNEYLDQRMDYWQGVADQNSFTAIWSLYSVASCTEKHPHVGHSELVYRCHWGEHEVRVPIQGDDYLALYRAADRAIRDSGDRHHVFIESFSVNSRGELELGTGS